MLAGVGGDVAPGQTADSMVSPSGQHETVAFLSVAVESTLPRLARHVSFSPGEESVALRIPDASRSVLDSVARKSGTVVIREDLARCDDGTRPGCESWGGFDIGVSVSSFEFTEDGRKGKAAVYLSKEGAGPRGGGFAVLYEVRLERVPTGAWRVVRTRIIGVT